MKISKAPNSEPFTNSLLAELDLLDNCKLNTKGTAQVLKISKPGYKITATIPIDVYEIFWSVKTTSEKFEGWEDFEGKSKNEDYLNTLLKFKELIDGKASLQFENHNVYYRAGQDKELWY